MTTDDEKAHLLGAATSDTTDSSTFFDVIIIGAGISGINAAYRLQKEGPPGATYAILDSRDTLGGTWDLFKYPGIRSDSDIFTFGFSWSPWSPQTGNLASGDVIMDYIRDSTRSAGIDKHIRLNHAVKSANWSSPGKRWNLEVSRDGAEKTTTFSSRFFILGTGYYDYEKPLTAAIPGINTFKGEVVHPQFWPQDLDYTDKNVVVIGSGATAITLVPSMAPKARSVTMLQRSPGYIYTLYSRDFVRTWLFRLLPRRIANFLARFLWILSSTLSTMFCRRYPELAKRLIREDTVKELPARIPWDPHFNPRYNPWEQRFCASMDGDFFAALRSGRADVVSGTIKQVTADAIELDDGKTLRPDVIVTATGLRLLFGGGITFSVDGVPFRAPDKFAWRSVMLQDVPNMFYMNGYEAASWTLGADVGARTCMRILRNMKRRGAEVAVPRVSDGSMAARPAMSLSSTYLKNISDVMPKTGDGQWATKTHYLRDMAGALWGDVSTGLEVS